MTALTNKRIILGITGGIAAYKSPDIVRRLREWGAQVQVIMTHAAQEFITPLCLQAVSGRPVHTDLLDTKAEAAMGHIELARWADLILVAPATAQFIANAAIGAASDLLSAVCLASAAKRVMAPAMNQQMWLAAATQANIQTLKKFGYEILDPAQGSQACGDVGPGRMPEAVDIVAKLAQFFETGLLSGLHLLLTAGPTQEPIDPVRFISNKSSGKMGYAIAEAAIEAGAAVTLISGQVALPKPERINFISVITAEEMYAAVMAAISQQNIFIATAAVADYRLKNPSPKKIKKTLNNINLELEPTPDILASVAAKQQAGLFIVGFAAETENLLVNAKTKLKQKKLDMIVANAVGAAEGGFASDYNSATILWNEQQKSYPLIAKAQLARELITVIARYYNEKYPIKSS